MKKKTYAGLIDLELQRAVLKMKVSLFTCKAEILTGVVYMISR